MATTPAPAASALPLHSAWNPYSVLAPSTRRKIDPPNTLLATPYGVVLSIPSPVAAERLSSKYLQLDAPEGKLSDRRKAELAKREEEKAKKRTKRLRDAECGMVGRRKRARRGDEVEKPVRYDAVLPIHQLWLGYMSELLSLPLLVSTPSAAFAPTVNTPPPPPTQSTSALLPTFSSRQFEGVGGATPADLRLNVPALHAKLVKAEFVGSILSVKRAKNPSLINLQGIVLQETQGTFKIVTPKSQIKILPKKGSIFTFLLPLPLPPSADASETKRELSFDIYGDAFCYRSAERVGKKFKSGSGGGGVELL